MPQQLPITLIDGRSGAGKTELAARLAARGRARVIHMDDLYPGWQGLLGGQEYLLTQILRPLLTTRTARWQNWDWQLHRRTTWDSANSAEKLIIEGCGSLTPETAAVATHRIWLEVAPEVRRDRIRFRDGADWWWEMWAAQEAAHIAQNRPAELATRSR